MNIPPVSDGRSAFREVDTSHLVATHTSVKIPGGLRYARIGATFERNGQQLLVLDVGKFHGRELNALAVCLGYRRGPEMVACPVCQEALTFAELEHAHLGGRGKTIEDLAKNGEQHVFAMFCEDAFDPEAQAEADARYAENVEALTKLRKSGRILEAQALLATIGGEPKKPGLRIVGLVMPAGLSGRFDTAAAPAR